MIGVLLILTLVLAVLWNDSRESDLVVKAHAKIENAARLIHSDPELAWKLLQSAKADLADTNLLHWLRTKYWK